MAEPHLLPGRQVDAQQQQYRGWDDDSWQRAADRVRGRDTAEPETVADELAAPAYEVLTADGRAELARLLEPLAGAVSAQLPYPKRDGPAPAVADRSRGVTCRTGALLRRVADQGSEWTGSTVTSPGPGGRSRRLVLVPVLVLVLVLVLVWLWCVAYVGVTLVHAVRVRAVQRSRPATGRPDVHPSRP